jgi:hypothetical protein
VKHLKVLAALFAFFVPVASSQEIAAESLGPGQFRVVLKSEIVLEVSEAQSILLPKASALCQGLEPVLGHYEFSSSARIDGPASPNEPTVFQLTQDISCGRASTNPQIGSARNSAFGVVKGDTQQTIEEFIRAASSSYLSQRADGAFENAYIAFSEAMRTFLPLEEWKRQNSEFNAAAGKRKSTAIWRVTIYDNPQNAPESGLYIAADYESEFDHVPFQCGYLIWFQSSDRRFVITREESGSLPGSTVERLPRERVLEIRKQFGCPAR